MGTPRHLVTIRRQGTAEPSQGPGRDIVWLTPDILSAVGQSLIDGHMEPFVRAFAERNGVDPPALAAAFDAMARAVTHFTDGANDHPAAAVDEVGLFDAPPAARLVLFAKLGMAFLSVAHYHCRGVELSPIDRDLFRARMAEMIRQSELVLAASRRREP